MLGKLIRRGPKMSISEPGYAEFGQWQIQAVEGVTGHLFDSQGTILLASSIVTRHV